MSNSIWGTLEMTCASMGFDYDNYKDLHDRSEEKGAILSENGYSLIVQVFDNSYAEYCAECSAANYKLEPLDLPLEGRV